MKTSWYAKEMGMTQGRAAAELGYLVRLKLIGQQGSLGFGNFESTWKPERTDAWASG